MKKTNDEELAVQSLYNYVQFFNEKDKEKILNCLHFPHMAHSKIMILLFIKIKMNLGNI